MNSLPFFNQRKVGLGVPLDGHLNFTVLAAGTACSFFSIFSGDVQYGATAVQEKARETDEGSRGGQARSEARAQAGPHASRLPAQYPRSSRGAATRHHGPQVI